MEPTAEPTAEPTIEHGTEHATEHATEPAVEVPVVAGTVVEPAQAAPAQMSLYNNMSTTFVAVLLGIFIVAGIQLTVARIFVRERNEHRALTQFVTSMVGIMVGVYVSDMLIAGPHVELLAESERTAILGFVKDTALMIFAFYFGTKATAKEE